MSPSRLRDLLRGFPRARIAVLGDFCVDVYYEVDLAAAETSLETGLMTRPVRRQTVSLGGAGNVAANLRTLGVGMVSAFGVVGADAYGRELRRLLEAAGIRSDGLMVQAEGWATNAYVKPVLGENEDHRIDLGAFNDLSNASAAKILTALDEALPQHDVLVINQQFRRGLYSPAMQASLRELLARHPDVIVLQDSRQLGRLGDLSLQKINAFEAVRQAFGPREPGSEVSRLEALQAARQLHDSHRRPVFITRGEVGCIVVDESGVTEIPGLQVDPPTDSVGAGDTMLAGIAACLGVGATPVEAARVGNLAAAVTVRKLRQTGTVSPSEIVAMGENAVYVHHPDLAAAPRGELVSGTEIEIVEAPPAGGPIRCVVFDHDGTLSTLRQGWEQVMEDMMARAVLGPMQARVDENLRRRIAEDVRTHIRRTTGLPTLRQMEGLVQRIERAGFVARKDVPSATACKEAYAMLLDNQLANRRALLAEGRCDPADFMIKGALGFLRRLHAAGVLLCLASGTDEPAVLLEAEALGYASLFGERIFGARADPNYNAKHAVLENLLSPAGGFGRGEIAVIGDGPAEIREARQHGTMAIGVASDEVQRSGLNAEKRSRLIRAGAHVVISDYAEADALFGLLRLESASLSSFR